MILTVFEPHIFLNPLLPFYLGRNYIRPFATRSSNWHTNIEIIYCVRGEGVVNCGSRSHRISKGDMIVVNSQVTHHINTNSEFEYYWLIIDEEFCKENGIYTSELIFEEFISSESLSNMYMEVINTVENKESFSQAYVYALIRSKLLRLLITMCDCCLSENIERNISNSASLERIKETMIYIQRNFANKLTLEGLSANVGVCKNYLAREFKKHTQMTVVEYINSVRCKNAQMHILKGESITVAATVSGFENLSYFSRTYKKHIGFLPKETAKKKQDR